MRDVDDEACLQTLPRIEGVDSRNLGLIIAGIGVVVVVIGVLVATGALSWFGRLPGDIRIEGENTRVYVPITSMILVSVALTLIITLLRRLL